MEDVLALGQPIEVRVDDIDPQGKVSLSLASVPESDGADDGPAPERHRAPAAAPSNGGGSSSASSSSSGGAVPTASFEDAFEAELVADLGDLGPGAAAGEQRDRGGDRGDRRPPRNRSRRR